MDYLLVLLVALGFGYLGYAYGVRVKTAVETVVEDVKKL